MANTTITNLPLATSINGTEQIPAVQSSATVRLTVNQLVAFTSSTLPAPVVTIGGAVSGGTPGNGLFVNSSGNLADFPYGTGVFNAIQIATGTNGAMVLLNGDAGTPTSLVLTNATGTPASLVLTNATGTPASINLTNAISLPVTGILATGTPSASTFLRGDSTWAPIVLTVGTTAISGATNGYLLYNNGGTLGSVAPTAASLSIGSPITGGTSGYGLYVDASSQLAQFAYGTGVRTALGNATNAASGLVTYSGSFGTPSSINLTNAALLSLPVGSISATGTANNTTYLRGDGSWQAIGSGGVTVNTGVTNQLSYYSGTSAISGNANATISGGALTLGVQSTTAGSIVLANTNVAARATTIRSSASASAAWTLTLPVSAGSSTNVLSTDGTGVTSWVAAGVGSVTSVGFTGGIITVNTPTSTPAFVVSGTSGGIPYFSSTSAWASSAALTLNGVVYGGGAGASPASTAAGTTGQVLIATTSAAPSWGQVPIAGGGTGQTTTALGTIVVGASGSTTTNLGIGTTGQILTVSGGTAAWATSGAVTSLSVVTANGISGTVTSTTTPAITLTLGVITPTSVNGLTLAALSTGFSVAGGTTSKTLTVSNTLTLAGTDSTVMTFPPASASIGYLNIPQNSQGGNYTLVLADSGKHIYTTALATITIPAESSVNFAIGTAVTFVNSSASATTIAITTDTMRLSPAGTTGSRTLAQYGMATAIKVASGVWYISGTGLT